MNSITIATKTTRMKIRLQTAVIQASKRGSDPKAITGRLGAGGGGRGTSTHLYHSPVLSWIPQGSNLSKSRHPPLPGAGESWKGCGS